MRVEAQVIKAVSNWRVAAAAARDSIVRSRTASHNRKAIARLAEEMRACLEGRGGDVSARVRAVSLGSHYLELDEEGREQFFRLLGTYAVDPTVLEAAIASLRTASDDEQRFERARTLRSVSQAPWVRLLTQFNSIPGGVKFLVDLRADLLRMADRDPVFARIDADLHDILASWFDIGFLELREITWDAPAAFLEKLGRYEAVHEMRDWLDLKARLHGNRRCFAFLHPAMPDEPLIFVEVALGNELAPAIAPLISRESSTAPAVPAPTVAIFYSISNCQRGLSGISFGNALIKRVVARLSQQFRSLRTFATLSPIPGFMPWLETHLQVEDPEGIASLLRKRAWHRDQKGAEALKVPLLRLCAHYLLREKRNEIFARDPVEHFHLSNGAKLERINYLGDTSAKGLRESAGLMVNYLYAVDRIDANHEAYLTEGTIDVAQPVRNLAKPKR